MANTISEQLQWAYRLVYNAETHPSIQQKLAELGFKPENILSGKTLLEDAESKEQVQRSSYEKKLAATDAFHQQLQEVKGEFREHQTLAKLAYSDQRPMRKSLGLDRPQASRQGEWIIQVIDFYTELLKDPKPMAKYGVNKAKLEQALASAKSARKLLVEQQQAKGDAQQATQHKQQALQNLKRWCRDFQTIAEVALRDDPQLMEVLGKTVPSSK